MDTTLRSKLIRLAHAQPELRSELLPLLTKEACGYMADDDGKQGCGYEADDDGLMAGKQMHNVKPEKGKGYTTKADPQRDPYARSLSQGQFQPKTVPGKPKYPDPKHKGKGYDKYAAAPISEGTYSSLHDALHDVGKECKELKAKAKDPKAKAKFDVVLKAVESGQDALDALMDME